MIVHTVFYINVLFWTPLTFTVWTKTVVKISSLYCAEQRKSYSVVKKIVPI